MGGDFCKEGVKKMLKQAISLEKELILVKKLLKVSEEKNLFGTEEELFKKLRRR